MSDAEFATSAVATDMTSEVASTPSADLSGGDYLSAIQNASSTPDEVPETEPTPAEEPAAEAANPEAPATPASGLEAAVESIRQALRKSNFDPARKGELADAWYTSQFYKEKGYTPDLIKQLDASGVTPDSIGERLTVHPTLEDARRDSSLAADMRAMAEDFRSNPEAMVDKLYNASPESYARLAAAFNAKAQQYAPDAYTSATSQAVWDILGLVKQNGEQNGNADLVAAVEILSSELFPNAGQSASQPATGKLNPQDPIHQKYQQLQEQQRQFEAQQATAFENGLRQSGYTALLNEVESRVKAAAPTGMPDEYRERMAQDVLQGVVKDIWGNKNLLSDLRAFLSGPKTQEQMQKAVQYLTERAKPAITVHHKRALEFWGKPFAAQAAARQEVQKQAAARPDVGRVGTAPAVAAPKSSVVSDMKAQGWDIQRALAENWARVSRR